MFGQIMSESVVLPRKRRRPALSCVECRRRKIKCDRNVPCTQCTQPKSSSCTYKDDYLGSMNGSGQISKQTSTTATSSTVHSSSDLGEAGLISPCVSGVTEQNTNPIESSARTVPLFHEHSHGPLFNEPPSSSSTTLYSSSAGSPEDPEKNVQVLLDRVKKLEDTLKTVSPGNLDPLWTSFSGTDNQTFFGQATRIPVPELGGSVSKTRLFGQSHWMCAFEHFNKISNFRSQTGIDPVDLNHHEIRTSEIKTLLDKCKTMARAAKAERPTQWHIDPNFKDYVPPRGTSDKLINLYLRTFESTLRILHVPTFEREYVEYWKDPENASTGFLVKLLLAMAIGTTFYQEADFYSIRSAAQQWVYAAQSWMSAPFEKGRLNLSGLQVHCLVLIARQATGVGGDLVWISVGSLVRMAITMGFHRDPKLFPRMTVLHAELRRRLWATVLELAITSSFDSGNPPLISPGDWDTEPPSNINDNEIDELTKVAPISKPPKVYTQTSLQIQLLKSLRTRLEISRLIGDFRFRASYDDILRLGAEVVSFGRDGMLLAQDIAEGELKPTVFHRNFLDTPIRRVLLALHFPYAMKARGDPRFYFSRKVCLDTALTVLTYPSTSSPTKPNSLAEGHHDDYTRLKLVGGGFFKETLIYAAIIVQLELITQLEEESPLMRNELGRQARRPLREYMSYMIDLSAQRIMLGENNIKGHLFLSAVSAQVDAMESGVDPDAKIAKAAKDSAGTCYNLLKARIKKPPSSVVDEVELPKSGDGFGTGNIEMQFGMDQEFAFEYLMPDASTNFDIPESWLFEGWEEHHEW